MEVYKSTQLDATVWERNAETIKLKTTEKPSLDYNKHSVAKQKCYAMLQDYKKN